MKSAAFRQWLASRSGGQWAAFWLARSARERRMLVLAMAFAGAAFGWLLLIEPLLDARAQLMESLPGLRTQAAEIDALARTLAAASPASATAEPTAAALTDSLARHRLASAAVAEAGGQWTLTLRGVALDAVGGWSREAAVTFGLQVQSAHAEPAGTTGLVDATLVLAAGAR